MSTITFKAIARLQIMAMLNEKATGKGIDREYQIATDLYDKIYIPDEEQERLSIKQRDGTKMLSVDALRSLPDLEVDLNFNELSKLEKVLKDNDIRPMDRKLWWADVMAQLEETKKPKLEDEAVRSRHLDVLRAGNRNQKPGD